MNNESRVLYKTFSIIGVILIVLPKINIIDIPGQTAGLRIDDIILMAVFTFLAAIALLGQVRIKIKYILPFSAFIAWGLISIAINKVFPTEAPAANALYQIRYIEYFLFFFLGYSTYKAGIPITKIAWIILISNAITMTLQYNNLVGGFASGAGYTPDASTRVIGLTGGPWEVGVLLNFCFAIIAHDYVQNDKKLTKPIALFSLTLYLIVLTGARTPFLAHLFILLACIYPITRSRPHLIIVAIIACTFAVGIIANTDNALTSRSSQLLNQNNFTYLANIYSNVNPSALINDEANAMAFDAEGDLSWLIRAKKWVIATRLYIESPPVYKMIGLGPGTWGPALDGGWIRIITELGIVGFVLFLWILWKILKINSTTMMLVISLSINMIFIDAHLAYKIMAVFFLMAGYFSQHKCTLSTLSTHPIFQNASHAHSPSASPEIK